MVNIAIVHETALKLAEMGISVVAVHGIKDGRCTCGSTDCKAGKHPLPATAHWKDTATTDVDTINQWYTLYPYANLAIPAEANGLVILDYDGETGTVTYERQRAEHPEWFTACWIEHTGHGIHVYYKQPTMELTNGWTHNGVEVKVNNYTVCAPSNHINGKQYEWIRAPWNTAIAPIPAELLDTLNQGRKTATSQTKTATSQTRKPMGGVVVDGREPTTEDKQHASLWLNHYIRTALQSRDRTHNCYHLGEQLRDNDIPYRYAVNVIAPFYTELVNHNIKEKTPFTEHKARQQITNAYRMPKRQPAQRRQTQ